MNNKKSYHSIAYSKPLKYHNSLVILLNHIILYSGNNLLKEE